MLNLNWTPGYLPEIGDADVFYLAWDRLEDMPWVLRYEPEMEIYVHADYSDAYTGSTVCWATFKTPENYKQLRHQNLERGWAGDSVARD